MFSKQFTCSLIIELTIKDELMDIPLQGNKLSKPGAEPLFLAHFLLFNPYSSSLYC
jgi:hypothetical protein